MQPNMQNKFFEDLARLVNDAAGVAQGAGREVKAAIQHRTEEFLSDMDLVQREEFEAVREMASNARLENEKLRSEIEALQERLAKLETK